MLANFTSDLSCSIQCLFYTVSFAELKARQAKGLIASSTHLLAVADPDARVGSGGATLNALLVATELLSSQDGYTVSWHWSITDNSKMQCTKFKHM